MSPKPSFQGISPVILSSECDVLANNSAIPNSEQLSYPFRRAIVIEEIRWTLRGPYTHGSSLNLGALVSTKMSLGQKYLTRDATPIWLFATTMALSDEQNADTYFGPSTSYSQYRWRLPEPLYVEAGQILTSWFSRGADGFSESFNVRVSYVGKTVAPGQPRPRVIPVPYVAPWVTTSGLTYEQSNEFDLFNPFDVNLRVQRLTGRVLSFVSADTAETAKALTPVTAGSGVTVLINDSWGGKMVNNNTGPSDVFDCLRSAWTVDTIMPPKGVYEVRAWNMNAAQRLHIALIGVREEQL